MAARLLLLLLGAAITSTISAQSCGTSSVLGKFKRVIGGQNANAHEWPWHVSLMAWNDYRSRKMNHPLACGGSLISSQWVLTAGHCVFVPLSSTPGGPVRQRQPHELTLRFAEHDFSRNGGTEFEIAAQKIIPYPQFNYNSITNDIALIKLAKPVISTSYVSQICLPGQNYAFTSNNNCWLSGHGRSWGTANQNTLQEVHGSIQSAQQCSRNSVLRQNTIFRFTDNSKICFGVPGKGSCAGDSGGPLVCKVGGRWYQAGVTSGGYTSCTSKAPGVFTNVSHFRSWIDQVTRSN